MNTCRPSSVYTQSLYPEQPARDGTDMTLPALTGNLASINRQLQSEGPIYKISYDLSQSYLKFIDLR